MVKSPLQQMAGFSLMVWGQNTISTVTFITTVSSMVNFTAKKIHEFEWRLERGWVPSESPSRSR